MSVSYQTMTVGDVDVFYRESGPSDAPVILLLHGFPTAGHMFQDLIPLLAINYRVIAPDLPGFGNTKAPARGEFAYTFDNLAAVIDHFIEVLGLRRYALYIFDYGAPTGCRIALAHPERVTAIISQNGNAYLDGFSAAWEPWQTYWREPTPSTARPFRLKSFATGNIFMGLIARAFRRTATRSTSPTWRGLGPMKSSWISSSTTEATSPSIHPSRHTFERGSHPSWRHGARTIPFSFQLEHKPTSATCQRLKCICLTPATSPSRLTQRKLAS
jgi:pimeloyl-ACP methyl ester carboxylesterase